MISNNLKNKFTNIIQEILNNNHSISEKKSIKDNGRNLHFACPICGDSHSNVRQKRMYVLWDSMFVYCHNCEYVSNLYEFVKHFNYKFSDYDELNEIYTTIANAKKFKKADNENLNIYQSILFDIAIERDVLKKKLNLLEIDEFKEALDYCKSRFLHKFKDELLYCPKYKRLYVLNLIKGKIVYAQLRDITNTSKTKYFKFDVFELNSKCKIKIPDIDEDIKLKVKKLSSIYGLFNINYQKSITILEGPIDSFFIPNSISFGGANNSAHYIETLSNVRFLYDNDKKGKEKTIELLKNGREVFNWQNYLNANKLPQKIKDVNELFIHCIENKCTDKLKTLKNFFTNDKYSLYSI